MASQIKTASFLGLPPELRLKIYEHVCHLDIDCTILDDIEHICRRGTKATLIPNREANLYNSIPWLSLLFSCRTVHSELKSFMVEGTFLGNPRNRIYILEVEVYAADKDSDKKAIRKAIWRKIPCPPEHAETLNITIVTGSGEGPWTEGGPASLARAVYQILNHTCHNGPTMVRRRPLQNYYMRIKDLIINIDIGGVIRPPPGGCNSEPRWNYSTFVNGFQQISRAGLLFGYVGNIKVREIEKADIEDDMDIKVGNRPPAGVPPLFVQGSWQNYGFYWGV